MNTYLHIGIFIGFLLIIGNIFTYVLQDLFIFRPVKLNSDHEFRFSVPFTEHFIDGIHNGQINLLWFCRSEQKRPVVLYFHGNAGNLQKWGQLSDQFDKLGFDLMIYDYRGFGKSTGIRTEHTFHEDARVVYEFCLKHYSSDQITLFGRSMGSGVACHLAEHVAFSQLILETPYYSIRDLFSTYYPLLPSYLFLFKYRFKNYRWVGQLKQPVHILHGTKDFVVPLRCARRLKPLLKKGDTFTIISGGKHNDLKEYEEYRNMLEKILKRSISESAVNQ